VSSGNWNHSSKHRPEQDSYALSLSIDVSIWVAYVPYALVSTLFFLSLAYLVLLEIDNLLSSFLILSKEFVQHFLLHSGLEIREYGRGNPLR
jgi:hypothetical protein